MKRYSVDEFMQMTREEPMQWINYCEIMILRNGLIVLARPSYQECAIQYAMGVEGKTREEIDEEMRKDYLAPLEFYVDKYKMIAVWYNHIRMSDSQRINRFQMRVLKKLLAVGLIDKENMSTSYTDEYQRYLRRKNGVLE